MRKNLFITTVALTLGCSFATTALASVERFAVIIGHNKGERDDVELRYAEADAKRMADALKNVGQFSPANLVLLQGEEATTVRRTLITVNDRVRAAMARPQTEVTLFVYYSGHADAEALHLGRTRLELTELEQLVRGSSAKFRILLLDSCRSGSLTRVKGGRLSAPFRVHMDEPLDSEGVVFLTASSATEDAQESDALKGSYFTHFFVSGLLGAADADQNHQVSLEEAYGYAYDNTLRATSRTWSGTQHPTFRYDIRGKNDVVLAELRGRATNQSDLVFPPRRGYLIARDREDGAIVGELTELSASRRLRVPAGRYFIRGRAEDFLLEGTVTVPAGQTSYIDDGRLNQVAYARMVRKGGASRTSIAGPHAGYLYRTALKNAEGLCHGVFGGYVWNFEKYSINPRLHGCWGGFTNENVDATSNEFGAEVRLSHAWDLPVVTIDVGFTVGGSALTQSFTSERATSNTDTFALHLDAGAAVTVPLYRGVFGFTELALQSYFYEFRSTATDPSSWTSTVAFRNMFGLGIQL